MEELDERRADPGGRADQGVGRSWPLGYWDRGFECGSTHGYLSLFFYVVLSCVGRGLCDGLIIRPKESY
jgi:hypothetical protein